MRAPRVIIVGAGMGGLAAACDLARRGADVTVLERAATPGGKMRRVAVGGAEVDAGPTVFTMRWIFEGLFADAGEDIAAHLDLVPAELLARHAWRSGGRLDLFADVARSAEAIGDFAGAADARGYLDFCERARGICATLTGSFIGAERPSPLDLVRRVGLANLAALWQTAPLRSLWSALGDHFCDPRLRQLFGRYATYVGSSPFSAPATLMLIAHVEQDGVWLVRGGIHQVARALAGLAERQGARFRYEAHVEEIVVERGTAVGVRTANGEELRGDAVLFNGDSAALAGGLLGTGVSAAASGMAPRERSLSAVTWCLHARTDGFPLAHHNVFFAEDYRAEFDAIFRRRDITLAPTVYLCAQDRGEASAHRAGEPERLLALINAPADGDTAPHDKAALRDLAARAFALMEACGLRIEGESVATTPAGFHALFPGTGGALYGRVNHGTMGSFARPGAASRMRGLYLAGGSAHPGAGIPMATMSGRLAAGRLLADLSAAPRRTISFTPRLRPA
jgi:1-hydroxycarotenoid 3,4-desaturase